MHANEAFLAFTVFCVSEPAPWRPLSGCPLTSGVPFDVVVRPLSCCRGCSCSCEDRRPVGLLPLVFRGGERRRKERNLSPVVPPKRVCRRRLCRPSAVERLRPRGALNRARAPAAQVRKRAARLLGAHVASRCKHGPRCRARAPGIRTLATADAAHSSFPEERACARNLRRSACGLGYSR